VEIVSKNSLTSQTESTTIQMTNYSTNLLAPTLKEQGTTKHFFLKIFRKINEYSDPLSIYFRRLLFSNLSGQNSISTFESQTVNKKNRRSYDNFNEKALTWAAKNGVQSSVIDIFKILYAYNFALKTFVKVCLESNSKDSIQNKLKNEELKAKQNVANGKSTGSFENVYHNLKKKNAQEITLFESLKQKLVSVYIHLVLDHYKVIHCSVYQLQVFREIYLAKKIGFGFSNNYNAAQKIDELVEYNKSICKSSKCKLGGKMDEIYETAEKSKKENEKLLDEILKKLNILDLEEASIEEYLFE
jgi:hypothetical protein